MQREKGSAGFSGCRNSELFSGLKIWAFPFITAVFIRNRIIYELIRLRKLRERGAIKKLKNTHYYQVTEEGYVWLYYSLFNYSHFVNPLLSKVNKRGVRKVVGNQSKTEQAYSKIDDALRLLTSELGLVA
jgi:hypothetical protein